MYPCISRWTTSTLSALVILVLATSALAFVPPDRDGQGNDFAIELPRHQTAFLHGEQADADPDAHAAAARLRQALGDGWFVHAWNQYARTIRTSYGPGLVVAPGGLTHATEIQVEQLARGIIAAHPEVFGTDGGNLDIARNVHAAGLWSVIFRQVESGIAVRNAAVMLAFNDRGELFRIGSNIYTIDVTLRPTVEVQVARAVARAAVPYDPMSDLTPGEETLVLLPIHRAAGDVDLRLTHRIDVPTSAPPAMWRSYVDAHSGEVVFRSDRLNHLYSGSAQADVEVHSYCDGVSSGHPLARLFVDVQGVGTATTDVDGDFSLPGNIGATPYSAILEGPDFWIDCVDCGATSIIQGVIEPDVPALLYFDGSIARLDERDTFFYTNQTKIYIESIDPTFAIHPYRVQVNFDAGCNATHNWGEQRLRFYRERDGCANTGRLGDVIAHEFGHGIQGLLMGDGSQAEEGLGEGNADIAGTFMTDDPLIGRGFYLDQCDTGLVGRDCDNERRYPDDLTGQVHNDGQIICGFHWHCRENLEATMGAPAGKAYSAHLWHFSRKLFGHEGMTQPEQVEGYLIVDDDDGNLGNGTPNWDDIYEAAVRHGFGPYIPPSPNRIEIAHTPLIDTSDPGPFDVQAEILTYIAGDRVLPDEVELYIAQNGGAFLPVAMTPVSGDSVWTAQIPAQDTGTTITYYLRAAHSSGLEQLDPPDAPNEYHMFGIGEFDVAAEFLMEADDGWTVGAPGDSVWDGEWERDDPNITSALGTTYQPEDDHTPTPGTDCWVTGNPPPGSWPFIEELDGKTSLNSPVIDLAGASMVKGGVWIFTYFEGEGDYLDINLSTDGGASWSTIQHITTTHGEWTEIEIRLSPHDFEFTDQMQFRFVAEDVDPTFNYAECLIDDFHVEKLVPGSAGLETSAGAAPLRLELDHARPNPFNPTTDLSYSLPSRADVRMAIYDVHGQLVRQLVGGVQDAGRYTAHWDGRDARGGPAASGVYYARLEVGDWAESRTLVLVK